MPPPVAPLTAALDRIGDRWSLLVIDSLLEGPRRFGELGERVGGIAPNILTKRLRQLEADGVILATPYSDRPVRMSYELTASGRDLAGALSMLGTWGVRHTTSGPDRLHATCGSALEARLWCPTCDRVVDDPEADENIHL